MLQLENGLFLASVHCFTYRRSACYERLICCSTLSGANVAYLRAFVNREEPSDFVSPSFGFSSCIRTFPTVGHAVLFVGLSSFSCIKVEIYMFFDDI